MSYMADDLVSFKSLLQLAVEFINGREKLKDLKLRQKKHLVGTVFPASDFIFASGAYAVFPIRMSQKLGDDPLIKTLDIATKTLGWSTITTALSFIKQIDSKNILASIMDNILDKINLEYNRMYDVAEERGITSDSCFGIKCYYGMVAEKAKNLSGILNGSIRCSSFQKMYESLQQYTPGLWINIPMRRTPKGREMLLADLNKLAENLENITGIAVTNESLRKTVMVTNECKDYSSKIIHEISLGDKYPCSPVTLAEFIALIEITFQDYLSNPVLYRDILKQMYQEMLNRIRSSTYQIDVSKRPKVLFTPRFGGWDSLSQNYIQDYGGRTIYADWEILGYQNQIKTTGDMFENYADYLMETVDGFGLTNEEHANNVLKFALDNKIDAVVYNQLFGCHSLTASYPALKKKLIREGIPSTLVNFNKIGENTGQMKTRIEALMELLKK